MFEFSRSRSTDHHTEDTPQTVYKMLLRQQASNGELDMAIAASTIEDDEDDETEEFVIL